MYNNIYKVCIYNAHTNADFVSIKLKVTKDIASFKLQLATPCDFAAHAHPQQFSVLMC